MHILEGLYKILQTRILPEFGLILQEDSGSFPRICGVRAEGTGKTEGKSSLERPSGYCGLLHLGGKEAFTDGIEALCVALGHR